MSSSTRSSAGQSTVSVSADLGPAAASNPSPVSIPSDAISLVSSHILLEPSDQMEILPPAPGSDLVLPAGIDPADVPQFDLVDPDQQDLGLPDTQVVPRVEGGATTFHRRFATVVNMAGREWYVEVLKEDGVTSNASTRSIHIKLVH
jgi:hypothetical protein